MHIECERADQFLFDIGMLTVIGPIPSHFICVLGNRCTNLFIAGTGLRDEDRLRVQRSCGAAAVGVTLDSPNGTTTDVVSMGAGSPPRCNSHPLLELTEAEVI